MKFFGSATTKTVRADQLQPGDVITAVQYGDAPGEWYRLRIGERVTNIQPSHESIEDPDLVSLLVTRRLRRGVYTLSPDEQVEIKDK